MNRASIGSDNGLLPVRHQAIIWTNAGLLSIGHVGTKFSEIQNKIPDFSFMKMHLKMLSAKRRPFCPGEDELKRGQQGSSLTHAPFRVFQLAVHIWKPEDITIDLSRSDKGLLEDYPPKCMNLKELTIFYQICMKIRKYSCLIPQGSGKSRETRQLRGGGY